MKTVRQPKNGLKSELNLEGVKNEIKRVADMLEAKGWASNAYITLGMEGTAQRGLPSDDAAQLIDIIRQFVNHQFMLLLKGELPDEMDIPLNCMVGIEVRSENDLDRIDDLTDLGAQEVFVMFVPELPLDPDSIDLTQIKWTIIEGSMDADLQEWELEITIKAYESTYRFVAYDKSFEECSYERGVVSDKIVGFRNLKFI